MFASLLVANRGEIACRIFRTARRMGLRTIAVYSDADRTALHVREADEARAIGPPQARLSYLDQEKILEAARASGAEAIHPGYGFLSENAEFAEACAKSGIVFVGPSPRAIRDMGLKDQAKAIAARAGVPVVPGFQGEDQSETNLHLQAKTLGFPLMIKAIAGGGGKGMRIVASAPEFQPALESSRREARAAFGDDRVLLERYFAASRHIEVQVMADAHGNVIHLYERDCSIQRRHQKVVEEAPAFGLDDEVRERMFAASISIARAVAYSGAGTIEFLYDPTGRSFYFMEMNTRLQVEHPVSEMITGLDFVELQLRVAAGERLPVSQEEVKGSGHGIEARLYAEDPTQGFLPQTGRLHRLRWPEPGRDLRIETGVEEGDQISAFYDPMIAKVVALGRNRADAVSLLSHALHETTIFGLKTNKGFVERLLREGDFATSTPVTQAIDAQGAQAGRPPADLALFGIVAWLHREPSVPSALEGFTLSGMGRSFTLTLSVQGTTTSARISYSGSRLSMELDGRVHEITGVQRVEDKLTASIDGREVSGKIYVSSGRRQVFADLDGYQVLVTEPDHSDVRGSGASGGGTYRAPMPGRVLRVDVAVGDSVAPGQTLLVLEAMKMEHLLKASASGTITEIGAAEGQQVKEGDFLCRSEPAATKP